ncbi:molybdopterin-dependent oxidoreductase [Thalassotalea euphylliae]|uniref:nitrate reductase n=1 Tax=Thalassotalea euphylliae TaxID=1655234 RepID=UPI00363C3635
MAESITFEHMDTPNRTKNGALAASVASALSTQHQDRIVQSTCAYCGVGCGVDIKVEKGEAVSLSPSPQHPANFGRLCVKGSHLLDTVEAEGRLLYPEIGGERVSWPKATFHVAEKLNHIITEYGPDAVGFYVSGQLLTEDYYVANKLMKGYIGSANIDTNSRLCMSSAVSAYKRAFGEDLVPCNYEDLELTDLLVLVGSNAAWTHPVLFQRIERARQINPDFKIIVIDPRKTATAEGADLHLAIKPGSDAALFNGLLQYLDKTNHIDDAFIDQHCEGFEEALAEAKNWTLEKVANFCGLSVEEITAYYQSFAKSERVITMYSMGINQSTSGVDKCHSIINAHLASGKVGKAGSGPFSITGQPNAMGGREVGGLANQLAAHLDIENDKHRDLVQRFWQSPTICEKPGAKAMDMFEQMAEGKIKAVWIMATNPAVSLPDNALIKKALEKCELVVVSDCVAKNDTLAFADVKLPATPWLEKDGTVTNSERCISRQRPSIEPSGQAKHDWEIVSEVATAMGFDGFDYRKPSDVFNEFTALTAFENSGETNRFLDLSGIVDLSDREYQNLAPIQWPINTANPTGTKRLFGDSRFATKSSKARLFPITPKLPVQQISDEYPLVLNSGRFRDHWHTMTRTGNAGKLNQHLAKPYLSVNTFDAKKLGLQNEDIAHVTNATGQITVPVLVSDSVTQGQCFMPIHWNAQFASNAVVTNLYQRKVDPLSGQPEAKHTGVKLDKAEFSQYIDVLASASLPQSMMSDSDYAVFGKKEAFNHYQFANREATFDILSIKRHKAFQGEWISASVRGGEQHICLANGKLICAVFQRNEAFAEPLWTSEFFNKATLPFAEIQTLLSGSPPSPGLNSRNVCTCFNVSEYEIQQALEAGSDSVTKLGKQLKCGTNCGSCKPELQSLINKHLHGEQIPVTEVATA